MKLASTKRSYSVLGKIFYVHKTVKEKENKDCYHYEVSATFLNGFMKLEIRTESKFECDAPSNIICYRHIN